jgi:23S rRNA (cytosine1962-C5)-methyltransferase
VLNLFAYTGAFSLYAVRGGASQVVTVDIAQDAIEDARENFRLNGFDASGHEFIAADVYEYLDAQASEFFDLVIVDPPSLARRTEQVRRALRSYEKLNHAALERVPDLGLLASASCTARVTLPDFRQMLASAARKARTMLQVLDERSHALDHPVRAEHPEGQYLKFVLSRRLPRA